MHKFLGLMLTVLLLAATLIPTRANSQDVFPDEPGRDLLILACSQCHSAGKMLNVELTRAEWEFTLYDMLARGANVHADDVDNLLAYLQNNYASDSQKSDAEEGE